MYIAPKNEYAKSSNALYKEQSIYYRYSLFLLGECLENWINLIENYSMKLLAKSKCTLDNKTLKLLWSSKKKKFMGLNNS